MKDFILDSKLANDCHLLGKMDDNILLLMRNSLYPWFILVPQTNEIELYKLDQDNQQKILSQMNEISKFVEDNFKIDKINIGLIGNMVPQLHVHIIGRHKQDACWPGVVWGGSKFKPYDVSEVTKIKEKLNHFFKQLIQVEL